MRIVQALMTKVLDARNEKADAPGAKEGNMEERTCGIVSPITTCGRP